METLENYIQKRHEWHNLKCLERCIDATDASLEAVEDLTKQITDTLIEASKQAIKEVMMHDTELYIDDLISQAEVIVRDRLLKSSVEAS